MKKIVFPDEHKKVPGIDRIDFPAIVDGKTIMCRIALEEIASEFGRCTPLTFEDDFRRWRPQIEELMKEKIQRKESDKE